MDVTKDNGYSTACYTKAIWGFIFAMLAILATLIALFGLSFLPFHSIAVQAYVVLLSLFIGIFMAGLSFICFATMDGGEKGRK